MTHPIREAAEAKAEALSQSILRLTTHYEISMFGHDEMIAAITAALLAARVEGMREAAQFMDKYPGSVANGVRVITVNAGRPSNPSVTFGDQLRARADEIEKEMGS